MNSLPFLAKLPRWGRRVVAGAGLLVLLYAILGFLVAPTLLRSRLPRELTRILNRPASLQRVRINPFALSATLEGFRIDDLDGEVLFGWDRLYVNLQLATLFTRTISLKTIEWERPRGRVVVLADGSLNLSVLAERLAPGPAAKTPAAKPRELAIAHLAIRDAQVRFLDHSLAEPFSTTLGPVSMELDGFRMTRDRRNPHTLSGRTEAGETFTWNGQFALEPLRAEGVLAIQRLRLPKYHPYYRDQVAFELRDGFASARIGYALQWSEGDHRIQLRDSSFNLEQLVLAAPGPGAPALTLPALSVQGLQADLLARSLEIGAIQARDGSLNVTRELDGRISLVQLLTPKPAPPPKEPARPWQVAVKELGLKGFRVAFEDRRGRPVPILAEQLDCTLQGLSLDPAASAKLALSLRLNKAAVSAEGSVSPLRPALDLALKVDGLALPPFDPYLAPATDIRLNRGSLSLQGRLRAAFEGRPADAAGFQGDLRVEGFEAMDGAGREPFLGWRSLRLTGMDLRSQPAAASIRSIDLTGLEGRLVVAADGASNLTRAFKAGPAPAAAPAPAPAPAPAGPPPDLSIGQIALKGGRLTFLDQSINPGASLQLTDVEGTYSNLSTRPDSRSSLNLKALAGGIAPLQLQGRALVLRQDQETDLALNLKGSDLADFSPYAGRFLGYGIHKGKLEVDARIQVRQRGLDALLKTRLDQFYLGEPSHSPDATTLPVKLGLALLRDRRGVIDLELPVQGSLDDPDFHYGKIVWKAVLNVFAKVLTSPFTLLGKLAGAGDRDLSFVPFPAGSASADAEGTNRMAALVRVLAERPDLSLEAEGSADPAADGAALRRQALDRLLLQARARQGDPAEGGLGAEERRRWLKVAYDASFPPAPAAKGGNKAVAAPAPSAEAMEQRLLATLTVSAVELRQLAGARAKSLMRFLQEAKVEPGRLFEVDGGARARTEGGSRVYLGLR
jgi:uncharacterized protein involved in outer membrane biogenesis